MAINGSNINELFRQIQAGEKKAFDQVYLQHFDNLKRFALQYLKNEAEAEEIVSERFVQLWLRRATLADIHSPVFYLYRSVKNACLTYLKREAKYPQVPIEELGAAEAQVTASADPEQVLEYKELLAYLDQVVDNLPDQRKAIFRMVKEDRLKCREVAELLGLSVRTVENQVYLAVKQLNEEVERYFNSGSAGGSLRQLLLLLI
ncbi:RNA polymerase sigma-70 factor [Parapedobacter sp. DT-150]|uniref:RNA polymerase sigma-70 factor n=1 Tax=Parapedobacter sp. DT-150 TaxID=3396162 RepID=UPI003F1C0A71